MSIKRVTLAIVLGTALVAVPEFASAASALVATPIPEPSDLALFLIGVAGLIIGRRSARGRKRKNDPDA